MVVPESEGVELPLQLQEEQQKNNMNMDEFLNSIWTPEENQAHAQAQAQAQNPGANSTQRQVTFGEMTLEDFLVQAGVVREQGNTVPPPARRPQHYAAAMYPNSNTPPAIAPTYVGRPVMGLGYGSVPAYQALPQGLGLGSPASPVSSDGLCVNPGIRGGGGGGRKSITDGLVEKVAERRKRRMIKNRESASRSRARKLARTAELEAELNELKEENASLKQALAEMDGKRKQQAFEEVKPTTPTKAQKAKEKLRLLRRTLSWPS